MQVLTTCAFSIARCRKLCKSKGVILTGQTRLRFGSVWFSSVHFGRMRGQNQFGSLWFNMASVDIINFENKYDYPDNYELQQRRRSSVAVEWYKKCITTASSTVLLYNISVFKALQKHQLTTHDNYNYIFFAYTCPPYWTKLNLLMSSVHFGRKPNRKRVCSSLNRASQNHYGSERNRTGTDRNHALKLRSLVFWHKIHRKLYFIGRRTVYTLPVHGGTRFPRTERPTATKFSASLVSSVVLEVCLYPYL